MSKHMIQQKFDFVPALQTSLEKLIILSAHSGLLCITFSDHPRREDPGTW